MERIIAYHGLELSPKMQSNGQKPSNASNASHFLNFLLRHFHIRSHRPSRVRYVFRVMPPVPLLLRNYEKL